MRSLTYFIAVTLDGHIAGPDGGDPTGPDGFWPVAQDYVERIVAEYPETLPIPAREALGVTGEGRHFDLVVSGSATYRIGLDAGATNAYALEQKVFSRSLPASEDPSVEVLRGDPVAAVRELKASGGDRDIWLVGGGRLAAALYDEIDTLVLKLSPLTTGSGIGLFGDAAPFRPRLWQLTDCTPLDSGVVFLTYRRT